MKIGLLGYGKMGQLIEQYAVKRGHEIAWIIDADDRATIDTENLVKADIAIDFSTPDAALENISLCFENNLPIVVGTTGWYEHLDEVKATCLEADQSMLYGSNFSIGVNIFFHVNRLLAKAVSPYKQYDAQVEEIHHIHKLDSPSGTAITIAEGILDAYAEKDKWVNRLEGSGEEVIPAKSELLIESLRLEEVPGTHTVLYSSEVDQIEFKHTAHSRDGFALGAVVAAEWLVGRKGFFQVTEMFDFNNE